MTLGDIKWRVVFSFHEWLHGFYYRHVYAHESGFAKRVASVVETWERRRTRGDIPVEQTTWETDYRKGRWAFMEDLDEIARYHVIIGYIQHLQQDGAILDVGCGEGILLKRMPPRAYARYVGIDVSQQAVDRAGRLGGPKALFKQADAETYAPDGSFDVIVFNETLFYFKQPLDTLHHYSRFLAKDGLIITSMFTASPRAMAILRHVKEHYALMDEVKTLHGKKSWICSVFRPRDAAGGASGP